mgnify:CR=1 FL=1
MQTVEAINDALARQLPIVEELVRIAGVDQVPATPFPRGDNPRKPVLTPMQVRAAKAKLEHPGFKVYLEDGRLDDVALQPVRVLILVDQDVAEALLPLRQHFLVVREDGADVQQKIAEVAGVQRLQALLVQLVEALALAVGVVAGLVGDLVGRLALDHFQRLEHGAGEPRAPQAARAAAHRRRQIPGAVSAAPRLAHRPELSPPAARHLALLCDVAGGARSRPDDLRLGQAAAEALGRLSPAIMDSSAPLLPELRHAREVAVEIALAVALQAIEDGVAPSATEEELRDAVLANQWYPDYYRLPL